jgi:hypothetical protein
MAAPFRATIPAFTRHVTISTFILLFFLAREVGIAEF